MLDTCTYVDLDQLDPAVLPVVPEITAITMAEPHQGVAMARTPAVRAARTEKVGAAIVDFDPCRSTATRPPGTARWSR
ncbi:hypothetical protein GCM10029964_033680 [Kibdelosporangium lantanae]